MKDLNDLFGGADIMGMVGKLQEDMQKAQAELETVEVEGVSGGGLVRIKASAKGAVSWACRSTTVWSCPPTRPCWRISSSPRSTTRRPRRTKWRARTWAR